MADSNMRIIISAIDAAEGAAGYNDAVMTLLGNAEALMQDRNAIWSITMLLNGASLSIGQAVGMGLLPGTSKGGASSYMLTGTGKPNLGQKAAGGPVQMGQPYIVGEKGPEMFVPNSSGTIIPNDRAGGININNKYYGNVGFTLGKDGMKTSEFLKQMGVAA